MNIYTCKDCREIGELDAFNLCGFCGSDNVRPADDDDTYYRDPFSDCLDEDDRGCQQFHYEQMGG